MGDTTRYWRVGHTTDQTETGMHMNVDYICTQWVGHPAQQSFERQIMEEFCRSKYGPSVVYVQGVAASPGWTLGECSKEAYERATPLKWGGEATCTKRIQLSIGRKQHSDPEWTVVHIADTKESPAAICPHCGQRMPTNE